MHPGDSLQAIGTTLFHSGVVASVRAFTDAAGAPGYGFVRLNQLATLLNVVGPIAEVASQETAPPGK